MAGLALCFLAWYPARDAGLSYNTVDEYVRQFLQRIVRPVYCQDCLQGGPARAAYEQVTVCLRRASGSVNECIAERLK